MNDLLTEIRQHAQQLDSFGATPRVLVLAANEIERLTNELRDTKDLLRLARETEEVLQEWVGKLEDTIEDTVALFECPNEFVLYASTSSGDHTQAEEWFKAQKARVEELEKERSTYDRFKEQHPSMLAEAERELAESEGPLFLFTTEQIDIAWVNANKRFDEEGDIGGINALAELGIIRCEGCDGKGTTWKCPTGEDITCPDCNGHKWRIDND